MLLLHLYFDIIIIVWVGGVMIKKALFDRRFFFSKKS